MKRLGTICILLLGLILMVVTACDRNDKEATGQQPTEGDTTVTITADGNIEALSHERLTFGSGGKVDKIYVKEGDNVSKSDVLAKLDTSALEMALTQAQVAVSHAEIAVTQAQINLQTAEYDLEQTQSNYSLKDIKAAESDVAIAQRDLDEALWTLSKYEPGTVGWQSYQRVVVFAQTRLNDAEDKLDAILSGGDSAQVAIKKLQVELAQQSLETTKQSLEAAKQSVRQAQKQLDEATIIAPFDGTVYKIGVKEGEFVSPAAYTGVTVVEIIDLKHMVLTARVDELDVVKVKTGQKVLISVDAMPGTKLEGRVIFISPVAREPGVVLFEDEDEEKEYEVKIDFDIPENSPIRAGMSATAEIIIE